MSHCSSESPKRAEAQNVASLRGNGNDSMTQCRYMAEILPIRRKTLYN